MPEKLEDRLCSVKCSAYGETRSIADIVKAMSDEQLHDLFVELLEHVLQSGEIKV